MPNAVRTTDGVEGNDATEFFQCSHPVQCFSASIASCTLWQRGLGMGEWPQSMANRPTLVGTTTGVYPFGLEGREVEAILWANGFIPSN